MSAKDTTSPDPNFSDFAHLIRPATKTSSQPKKCGRNRHGWEPLLKHSACAVAHITHISCLVPTPGCEAKAPAPSPFLTISAFVHSWSTHPAVQIWLWGFKYGVANGLHNGPYSGIWNYRKLSGEVKRISVGYKERM